MGLLWTPHLDYRDNMVLKEKMANGKYMKYLLLLAIWQHFFQSLWYSTFLSGDILLTFKYNPFIHF